MKFLKWFSSPKRKGKYNNVGVRGSRTVTKRETQLASRSHGILRAWTQAGEVDPHVSLNQIETDESAPTSFNFKDVLAYYGAERQDE